MGMVHSSSQRWRVLGAHAFLLCICATVVLPFWVVFTVSLTPGNFATGALWPSEVSLEHWRFVLGLGHRARRRGA